MASSSLRSFEYLEQLPGTTFKRLYQQPSTALAIFRRMLPHLAKTFVMAMLFLADPLPVAHLEAWVRSESKREQERAIDILDRLHIISTIQDPGQPRSYRLSNPFCASLRLALTGGGNHRSFGVPCETPEVDRVGTRVLDDFARTQWEAILYYVVGSAGPASSTQMTISKGTQDLLQYGQLVEIKGKTPTITEAGFTFLLQEINAQVWSLLIIYLQYSESGLSMDSVDVLAFLFTLGSLEIGQDYSTANLTSTQLTMLDDLHDFGIVYRLPTDTSRFYPTRLATTLTSDGNTATSLSTTNPALGGQSTNQKGFIVIETNYRIYAYTSSPLQISILALFSKLSTRYPNMVSGRLTKESIQRAIALGITSQQIISFLNAHAHPVMVERSRSQNASSGYGQQQAPVLPPTVVDQIRLWQIENDRMKATSGYLFNSFRDKAEYDGCVNYAETIGVLSWRSDAKRCFFVTQHEQIKKYLENRKK
jgi:transcription initiation factor TFIIH subunit 4